MRDCCSMTGGTRAEVLLAFSDGAETRALGDFSQGLFLEDALI